MDFEEEDPYRKLLDSDINDRDTRRFQDYLIKMTLTVYDELTLAKIGFFPSLVAHTFPESSWWSFRPLKETKDRTFKLLTQRSLNEEYNHMASVHWNRFNVFASQSVA